MGKSKRRARELVVLYHVAHHIEGKDEWLDGKIIGFYKSLQAAEAAHGAVKSQEGFRDMPAGFRFIAVPVDIVSREGYFEIPV